MSITAVMLMGAKPEPFLGACLESIRGAVDHLIVNDNSGLPEHSNLSMLQASELYRSGRVTIIPSTFLGFGPCRDLCLNELRKSDEPGRWVIFVDCDEVHVPSLRRVTQQLLPRLPERIGIVDGYNYNIYQSRDFFRSFDHRHNLMFRFRPDIHWTGQVHEKLQGITGKRLVIPYRYFHYGYLVRVENIFDKRRFYMKLGDGSTEVAEEEPLQYMRGVVPYLRLFNGKHPAAAAPIVEQYMRDNREWLAQVAAITLSQPLFNTKSRLRGLQIAAKMRWQRLLATLQLLDCPAALAELDIY